MGEAHPNRNSRGKILDWIKAQGLFVQVKALRSHEVWPISENEVPVFDAFKYEKRKLKKKQRKQKETNGQRCRKQLHRSSTTNREGKGHKRETVRHP